MEKNVPTVKMKYSEVSAFEFVQTMQKISNTPVDNKTACAIKKVVKVLDQANEGIRKEFKDTMVEKFAKRDEAGAIVVPKGNPVGFDIDEAKTEEFMKAQEEFGGKETELKCHPLSPTHLKDIKLSAKELSLLGPLFTEEEGPGVPHLQGL